MHACIFVNLYLHVFICVSVCMCIYMCMRMCICPLVHECMPLFERTNKGLPYAPSHLCNLLCPFDAKTPTSMKHFRCLIIEVTVDISKYSKPQKKGKRTTKLNELIEIMIPLKCISF